MVNALCAVANGGVLMQPQIVSKITDSCGEPSYELTPHKVRRVISEEAADHVREAMLLVTGEHGTGKLAAVDGFPTAGKTGTAFKPKKDRSKGYIPGHYIASFMGFLPAENPRLAGIVIVDDPVGKDAEGNDLSRYGGSVAGPVFREIADAAMQYMGVAPSVVPRRVVRSKVPMAAVRYAPRGDG
jgi:cell division protein FtsI (penicillin-binding protein 3)